MCTFELILIAVALAVDGPQGLAGTPGQVLRIAFFFGLFQFLMPLAGWVLGGSLAELICGYDHWVAFAILAVVAGRLIHESFGSGDHVQDITRGLPLLLLSVATSIDALAVGLSLAFLDSNILRASLLIGIVAFLGTVAGFLIGRKAGELLGRRARLAGGVVLLVVALRILVTHLVQGV
jgi:putative Mn2+ efflux pump MntP